MGPLVVSESGVKVAARRAFARRSDAGLTVTWIIERRAGKGALFAALTCPAAGGERKGAARERSALFSCASCARGR